jgi:hypothetical protein
MSTKKALELVSTDPTAAFATLLEKTAAGALPSVEEAARQWAAQVANAILAAIPRRYKADKAEVNKGASSDYVEVLCKGTSVRDLDVELTVGFMVDTFRGNTRGTIGWEEVGFRKQEVDINLRNDKSGSEIVELVMATVKANERG